MRETSAIRGIVIPVPTPFDYDGEIDEPVFRDLLDYYIAEGVNALFLFGSFGQGPAMYPEQRKRGLEIAIDQIRGRVPTIVHVGAVEPFTSVELGRHAIKLGVDAIGVVGPFYYNRGPDAVVEHYRYIDQALGAPLLIYNNPETQGYPMPPALMKRIVDAAPNAFGSKLATGGVDDAMRYRGVLGPDFALFALATALIPGLMVGITGTISPGLALGPRIGVDLVRAFDAGDIQRAMELQIQILEAAARPREGGGNRASQAEGLRRLGFDIKAYPRWPVARREAAVSAPAAVAAVPS